MKNPKDNLLTLLNYITDDAPPHRFHPHIVLCIKTMLEEIDTTNIVSDKLKRTALGLGIYISDDFEFSESEAGKKILAVVNSILRQTS